MVGTRLIQLHCVRAACSQKRPAENFGASARLPPCASGASMVTTRALMWYSGSTASTRSAGEEGGVVVGRGRPGGGGGGGGGLGRGAGGRRVARGVALGEHHALGLAR